MSETDNDASGNDWRLLNDIQLKLEETSSIAEKLVQQTLRDSISKQLKQIGEEIRAYMPQNRFGVLAKLSPIERFTLAFKKDHYLFYAIIGIPIALLDYIFDISGSHNAAKLSEALRGLYESMKGLLDTIFPQAHAQGIAAAAISPSDGIRFLILGIITVGFFFALGIIGFSDRADSRKWAADSIKTILGFYIGVATKIL